jgi:predicted  nucleic acid-binding Zn-ribbon protein
MESELERFHKRNTSLELNIDVLRQKLKATDKEMHMERQKVNNQNSTHNNNMHNNNNKHNNRPTTTSTTSE